MNMTIAERVKLLRKQEGLTQEQLAQALFVSDGAISHIEKGTRMPSKSLAVKLAARYGKSTDYFLVETPAAGSSGEFEINDSKRLLRISETLNQVLAEEKLTWDWEKKYKFVMELYAMGLGHDEMNVANDVQQIKTSLKLARLAA